MTVQEILEGLKAEFARRKFAAGLLLAYIAFLRHLGATNRKFRNFDHFLRRFPPLDTTHAGKRANTLIVASGKNKTVSLRPFYNEAERFFRAEKKRFDYPNCAPHATQAWRDYERWIDALLQLEDAELSKLEQEIKDFVLGELPSHEIDAGQLEPLEQRFTRLLQDFPMTAAKGEPHGAAFQGVVYGYIRADAPHLHLDISKVGAGSKRLQRVGDIDGWEGERLILSAEVKHFNLTDKDVLDIAAFQSEVTCRKAMGIVAALSFSETARKDLEGMGLRTMDQDDLIKFVELWDPLKQRAAVAAFTYYVHHIEQNSALKARLRSFVDGAAASDGSNEGGVKRATNPKAGQE